MRLRVAVQELVRGEDLEHAVVAAVVAQVHSVADDERLMQARDLGLGVRPGRVRLVALEREVADVLRVRRVAQVVGLEHARDAPTRRGAVHVRDTARAVPLELVRLAVPAVGLRARGDAGLGDRRDERGPGGIGHVEHLVAQEAVRAERVDLAPIGPCSGGVRQLAAVADLHVLRAARVVAGRRHVREVLRRGRVRHVDDREPVLLDLARERVRRLARVMADEQDPSLAVRVHDRLIRRARLEVIVPHEAHVHDALVALRERESRRERDARRGESELDLRGHDALLGMPRGTRVRHPRTPALGSKECRGDAHNWAH